LPSRDDVEYLIWSVTRYWKFPPKQTISSIPHHPSMASKLLEIDHAENRLEWVICFVEKLGTE